MKIHQQLKRYVNDFGYNKSCLARKVGKSPALFTQILNGKVQLRADDYKKICKAMGVTCAIVENYSSDYEEE